MGESPQIFALFKSRYPAPNDPSFGDGLNTAGFRFNSPEPDNLTNYTGREDYAFSPQVKFFGIGNVSRQNQVQSNGMEQFPGDPHPSSSSIAATGMQPAWTGKLANRSLTSSPTEAPFRTITTRDPQMSRGFTM